MKSIFVTAALFSALAFTPASAAMMACTSDNMAKTAAAVDGMPDGPAKFGMEKEMGMANTDISEGKMRSACGHYMKMQKMSVAK